MTIPLDPAGWAAADEALGDALRDTGLSGTYHGEAIRTKWRCLHPEVIPAPLRAYLAAVVPAPTTENPSLASIVAFLREPRDSTDVNLSLAVAADLIEREFAAGRAAATPDPRVPSGLPIGYGGPTIKTDPLVLLAQVKAVVDEQLDEREGFGPWRRDQFMRIDALLRDVAPAASPDERLREAERCYHEYQHNPASDDFGVCAKCGDEENAGSVQDGDSTPRPEPTPAGDGEGTEYARLTAALVELVACARLKWCGYEQEPRFGAALDEARSALAAADREKPETDT